jgi:density-regulated protein DRP1
MVLSAWTKHPSATAVETCKECKLPCEYCAYNSSCTNSSTSPSATLTTTTAKGDVSEKMDKMSLEEEEEDDAKKTKIKTEEKKKKKKEKQKCITITLTSRNKRKTITNVAGFEHFSSTFQDGNLKEVAKTLGKKFACGCSVTKGATNQDEIDLQGDYGEQIKEILVQKWKMEEELVVVVDKSKK